MNDRELFDVYGTPPQLVVFTQAGLRTDRWLLNSANPRLPISHDISRFGLCMTYSG